MKITALEIQSFMGLNVDETNLNTVNVFFGTNGSGKSGVFDAFHWSVTGSLSHRGIKHMNSSGCLGSNPMVNIFTDVGQYHRELYSSKSFDPPNEPVQKQYMEVLTNPASILTMPNATRQAVFSEIIGGDDTESKLRQQLANTAISEGMKSAIFQNMDKAQKNAVDKRRAAKRVVTEVESLAVEPEKMVEINKKQHDLSTLDLDGAKKAEIAFSARRDVLTGLLAQKSDLEALGVKLEENKKKLAELNPEKLKEEEKDAQTALLASNKEVDAKQAAYGMAKGGRQLNEKAIATLGEIKRSKKAAQNHHCPTCQGRIKDVNFVIQTQESLLKDAVFAEGVAENVWKEAAATQSTAKTKLGKIREALRTVDNAVGELERISESIDREIVLAKEQAKNRTGWQKELKQLDGRIANVTEGIAAKKEYDIKLAAATTAREKLDRAEAEIAEMNLIDEMLKPDGTLRQIATAAVETATFDEVLTEAWGFQSLRIEPDGKISLFGRPIEMASKSEQYRAVILFADLMASKIGAGIIFLDGLDILADTRGTMQSRMMAWASEGRYETIMCNVATDDVDFDNLPEDVNKWPRWMQTAPPEGLSYYWVGNGTVSTVDITETVPVLNAAGQQIN